MKKTKLLILIIGTLMIGSANAQLGNLFNQIVNEVQKNIPSDTLGGSSLKQIVSGGSGTISSQEFCEKLKNSQEMNEFAKQAKEIANTYNQQYKYDTKDGLIEKWLVGQLKPKSESDMRAQTNFIRPTEQAINECALQLRDSDLLYVFAYSADSYKALLKGIDKISAERAPQEARQLDASGNISTSSQIPKNNKAIFLVGDYSGNGSITRELGQNRLALSWMPSFLLVMDQNGQIIKNTNPEIKTEMTQRLANLKNERETNLANSAKEQKQRAANEAADQKERQANIDRYNAYISSPEGRLTYSYQRYQVLQTCNEIRKGYAVQFINDGELSKAKDKIKAIESKLKPLLNDKDTNKLWTQAIKRNQEFNPTEGNFIGMDIPLKVDLIATITNNNKGNWIAAKSDCDAMFNQFNEMSTEILGQATPKKNF